METKGAGYFDEMEDVFENLSRLLQQNQGFYLTADGKIDSFKRVAWDTPWIHVGHDGYKECNIWHHIFFPYFNMIHSRCHECWKVVIKPRTLKELFLLLELEEQLQRPSKCGIELRDYTSGLYSGFFYNNSLEEGRACYEVIREEVSKRLSPETSVILKRACTEFELKVGPSPYWKIMPGQLEVERRLNKMFVRDMTSSEQPDVLKKHIKRRWIRWAYQHGDDTYLEFTNGKTLYAPCVTYHEGSIEDIKKDLIAAQQVQNDSSERNIVSEVRP